MIEEVEAKFLRVKHDDVRAKLKALGAIREQEMRLMRRQMFDYPDGRFQGEKGQILRVRDEGDKITVTHKDRRGGQYAHETETTVDSFESMCAIFTAIGLVPYSYQESKREAWHYKNVEVVLDRWPWLDDYIEIEGPDEPAIQAAANELGFDWKDARFGSVDTAYKDQYKNMGEHDSIGDFSEVKFGEPLPDKVKAWQ